MSETAKIELRRPVGGNRNHSAIVLALLAGVGLTALAYITVWERGFYSDDYSNRTQVVDVTTGVERPIWSPQAIPDFPVRALAWAINRQLAVWLPTHEFPIRLWLAIGAGINALLLGSLVTRLLASPLAGVVAGWLFVAPFAAMEAVLWAGAASYIVAGGIVLLALHFLLNATTWESRVASAFMAFLAVALVLFSLIFFEQPATMLALAPFALALIAMRRPTPATAWKRLLILLAVIFVAAGAYGFAFYRNTQMITTRGALDLNPMRIIERCDGFLSRLHWMTLSSWGRGLTRDALWAGFDVVTQRPIGILLVAISGIFLLLSVGYWRQEGGREEPRGWSRFFVALLGAAAVFYASVWIPAVLVQGQILEYRMLYYPYLALCFGVGTIAWGATRILRRLAPERFALAFAGVLSLVSAIAMVGYSQAFAARNALDTAQRDAIMTAFPSDRIPANAVLAPLITDGRLFGRDDAINMLFCGAYEARWCARATLHTAYRRDDFDVLTLNRWTGLTIADAGNPGELMIQGERVAVDRLLPFIYRAGLVTPVSRVTLTSAGAEARVVEFPLAARFKDHGAARITLPLGTAAHAFSIEDETTKSTAPGE